MSSEETTLWTKFSKKENITPAILTFAMVVQFITMHIFMYKSKNDMFYYSVHATQTAKKDLNLIDSAIPQFVPGFDAFALLDKKPSQRALMEPLPLNAKNPFLDHCAHGNSAMIEKCKNNGTIPYMVMNKIHGKSFYMTGRHNANILLTFLLWSMSGILAMIIFFEFLGESLKDWRLQTTDLSKLKDKLSTWTWRSMLLCFVYVLTPFIYSYAVCPNCPDSESHWVNNASTFYGLVAIVSIAVSFYWSFATQKKAIVFLKTNFKNFDLLSTGAMISVEKQPLIAASNQKHEILIPASMSAVDVKSSSVKTSAIYDPSTRYDENMSFTINTFKELPFIPTNTFLLKAMIPLLFLWALFSKTQKSYGLDVDLQLYVLAMVCFAMNNYIFKKTLAFISYTFKWCNLAFIGVKTDTGYLKWVIFNSTYGQIVLSSVLIQFLIVVVLCIYEGRVWVANPIFSILWFIFWYDIVSLGFLIIDRKYDSNAVVNEGAPGEGNSEQAPNGFTNLLYWMLDTPFFAAYKYDSAPDTLYKPIGVVEFYGILVIFAIYMWALFGTMID